VEEVKSNIVYIDVSAKDKKISTDHYYGFGFITGGNSNKIYIATAKHTFEKLDLDTSELIITVNFHQDVNKYSASLIKKWDSDDLALLMVSLNFSSTWKKEIVDFNPDKGQLVSAIGFDKQCIPTMKHTPKRV